MKACRVNGCTRPVSKGKWQTTCDMHLMRKRRGQPMEAPSRYSVARKCRRCGLKPGEGMARLKALLLEGPHSVDELSAKLGAARSTVNVWLRALEDSGTYVESVTRPARRGSARVHLFYVYTGRDFEDSEAPCP